MHALSSNQRGIIQGLVDALEHVPGVQGIVLGGPYASGMARTRSTPRWCVQSFCTADHSKILKERGERALSRSPSDTRWNPPRHLEYAMAHFPLIVAADHIDSAQYPMS